MNELMDKFEVSKSFFGDIVVVSKLGDVLFYVQKPMPIEVAQSMDPKVLKKWIVRECTPELERALGMDEEMDGATQQELWPLLAGLDI